MDRNEIRKKVINALNERNALIFLDRLNELVERALAIEASLDRFLLMWLQEVIEPKHSRIILSIAIKESRSCFNFKFFSDFGWCITCSESISKQEDIINLPFLSNSSGAIDTTPAVIKIGDVVSLKSFERFWWQVEEFRPNQNLILLKMQISSSSSNKGVRKSDYTLVHLFHLYGSVVRRIASRMDIDKLQNALTPHFKVKAQVTTPDDIMASEYFFMMPTPDLKAAYKNFSDFIDDVNIDVTNIIKRHPTGKVINSPMLALQSTAHVKSWILKKQQIKKAKELLYGIPCIDMKAYDFWVQVCFSLRTISRGQKDLLTDFKDWTKSCVEELLENYYNLHVYRMLYTQSTDNIEELKDRFRDSRRCWEAQRPLTVADHPDIARIRALIRSSFSEQNLAYLHEAVTTQWYDVLLYLDPALCTALRLSDTLAALTDLVQGIPLRFLHRSTSSSKRVTGAASVEAAPLRWDNMGASMTLKVPVALHEVNLTQLDLHLRFAGIARDNHPEIRYVQSDPTAGVMTGMSETEASICVGDLVSLHDVVIGQMSHRAHSTSSLSGRSTWYEVLDIDLLFARILLYPTASPALHWYEQHRTRDEESDGGRSAHANASPHRYFHMEPTGRRNQFREPHLSIDEQDKRAFATMRDNPAYVWLPVSEIWGVTVARLGDGEGGAGVYNGTLRWANGKHGRVTSQCPSSEVTIVLHRRNRARIVFVR